MLEAKAGSWNNYFLFLSSFYNVSFFSYLSEGPRSVISLQMLLESNIWSSCPNVNAVFCLERKLHFSAILFESGLERICFPACLWEHECKAALRTAQAKTYSPAHHLSALSSALEIPDDSQLQAGSSGGEHRLFGVVIPIVLIHWNPRVASLPQVR